MKKVQVNFKNGNVNHSIQEELIALNDHKVISRTNLMLLTNQITEIFIVI